MCCIIIWRGIVDLINYLSFYFGCISSVKVMRMCGEKQSYRSVFGNYTIIEVCVKHGFQVNENGECPLCGAKYTDVKQ